MRKQTNYKLPEELITALQEKAVAERTTSTDLVIQALNSFLSNSSGDASRISDSIPDLVHRIDTLTQRLNELEFKKNISFMSNSPLSEANGVHIGIDSDMSQIPTYSEDQFSALVRRIDSVMLQNQNLWERVSLLEALMQKSNCQD